MAVTAESLRLKFFEHLFGETEGYVCLATQKPNQRTKLDQHFIKWPDDKEQVNVVCHKAGEQNIWFCVNLLSRRERRKEHCLPDNLVWADLEEVHPDSIVPPPQVVIESSTDRWQGIWLLEENVDPFTAELFSKKIAYAYSHNGADKSGWDLTQLLRVPFTRNYKYRSKPEVKLHRAAEVTLPVAVFWEMPEPTTAEETELDQTVPELLPPEDIIWRYTPSLDRVRFMELYSTEPEPDADWSKLLWRLIHVCFEAGMNPQEVISIVHVAKCNKYARDKRPIRYLWRDVKKAEHKQKSFNLQFGAKEPLTVPQLVTPDEQELEAPFIKQYQDWATNATDAVPVFHEVSAFIVLSAILAQYLRLETSYGPQIPNLWALILGDSTLTRKTTAMRLATSFIEEIEQDMILASDGSVEGLLTGLSQRPNRTSVYYRDEVTGFFDAMTRKDYLAGMPETLAQLYDVPSLLRRLLRKETITVTRPIFIFFGGGIRDKAYSLLTEEHVLSGFLPRFLIVSGEADIDAIRATGPATPFSVEGRTKILEHLNHLYHGYSNDNVMKIGGQEIVVGNNEIQVEAFLTTEAWERNAEIERLMDKTAHESAIPMIAIPTFARMARSILKMAILLAAARQEPIDNTIQVEKDDVVIAAKYGQRWLPFTVDLVQKVGIGASEQQLTRIMRTIRAHPGVLRSDIMTWHKLTAREMNEIEKTLIERYLISRDQAGRGWRYTAI